MAKHVVQSPEWGEFKTKYGTPSVTVGNIQYTKHKIPLTSYFYAYIPKVDPFEIDFEKLKRSLEENFCVAANFDVPNVISGSPEGSKAEEIFSKYCSKSPRATFARSNILLDLEKSEEELLAGMHTKHRYNIGLAKRKGVVVKRAETPEDFDVFFELLKSTAERQKYLIHPKYYYQTLWEMLYEKGIAHILTAYYKDTPLASWMLFTYDGVLYYPYGGSSEEYKNVFGSTLVAWESILLGKEFGCKVFDMWGSADNPEDTQDSWHGFTTFKLRFGGRFVRYIDSCDLVINPAAYNAFNLAQNIRWKLLGLMK